MEIDLKRTEEECHTGGPHGDKNICKSNEEEACIEEHSRDIKLCEKRMG